MSEMKPVFWIKKEHFSEFDGARGDLGLTIVAWNNSLNEYAKAHELKSMEVPLSAATAEQLAEAVAAERERCLRIVMREGITPAIPDDPDPVAEAINGALQNVHEAIRSAAK